MRSKRVSGTTFVVVLLGLSVLVAGTLAFQAVDAARSQRATAEGVLADYTAFAAEQYGTRAARELEFYGLYPTLQRLIDGGTAGAVPSPEALRAESNAALRQSLDLARYLFRVDLVNGSVTVGSDSNDLAPPWLGDSVTARVRLALEQGWPLGLVAAWPADGPRVFAYAPLSGEAAERTVYGMEMRLTELDRYFEAALRRGPVLPTALIGLLPYDSVLAVRVAAAGRELFGFPAGWHPDAPSAIPKSVVFPLPEGMAGLQIHMRLQAGVADRLVIGGLPRSRLPLTVGLFVLTVALIAAAGLLLRREGELAHLRAEFVSNVSHELRTPLAQMRLYVETLLLGRVRSDQERRGALQVIDQEARRLTSLVENVLHLSRAERNAVRLAPAPLPLLPIVAETADLFAPLAHAHEARVVVEGGEGIVARVDRGAVQQILINLLDNAVKYGPPGQTVRIRTAGANGRVRLAVEDEGPGIPRQERERIWRRFWRMDRARSSAVAGTGIGLAVVRELTELHGGRVWVESRAPRGSRFMVELPGDERPAREPGPGGTEARRPSP